MTWLKLTRRVLRRIAWFLRAELYQLAYRARIVSSELQTKSAGLDQKPWSIARATMMIRTGLLRKAQNKASQFLLGLVS